jgi:hypothetical protein
MRSAATKEKKKRSFMFNARRISFLFAWAIFLAGCGPKNAGAPATATVDYDVEAVVGAAPGKTGDFFSDTTYDREISTPEQLLGHPAGAKAARHADIVECFKTWAKESGRVDLKAYAKSHEGRELVRVVIASEENLKKLDEIKSKIAKLADPRGVKDPEARRIIEEAPAVAWLGYSIHGDELSGADASVAVGYHLIAGTSANVTDLLKEVVIVIDPVMNPDGRERFISYIDESASSVMNLDYMSMHRGRWPWGRGNHYLFDMNRDWIAGTQPETRGRWKALLEFHPQLVVDVHEMGSQDTYMFYPPSEPVNPSRPPHILKWQKVFADNHGAEFDALGWSYYTGEWADGWYPGYSDGWSSLNSAIGMLYEQAGLSGLPMLRASGRMVTYEETVRAQAVSSLSDLSTLAEHRKEILGDYYESRKASCEPDQKSVFALRPGRAPDRERAFILTLLRQGIEVYSADKGFSAANARGELGISKGPEKFEAGAYLIPKSQPQGALLSSVLDLDPRMPDSVLLEERQELEKKNESKMYDVTAWDLVRAFDLDGFWISDPKVPKSQVTEIETLKSEVISVDDGKACAWVVDGRDDVSVAFVVQAIELGVKVHVSDKDFTTAGKGFARGSLLIRRQENEADVEKQIKKAAELTGAQVIATSSCRSPDKGPDLGGQHFTLLNRPRIGVLTNWPVWPSEFGHVWHQLDTELKVPFTIIDIQMLDSFDLRRYNVIIIPQGGKSMESMLEPYAKTLASWVQSGGTLIAIGGSAAVIAQKSFELGSVSLKRDVLEKIEAYEEAAKRDLDSRDVKVDPRDVWSDAVKVAKQEPATEPAKTTGEGEGERDKSETRDKKPLTPDKEAAERDDIWRRTFSPMGVFLRGLVNLDSWLTFGCRNELPVLFWGDFAFLTKPPAQAPIRLAPKDRLRLAGLLWPEARERLAATAYVTVEPMGDGQVILFASSPSFRGFFKGTARLLANAIIFGPSLGAKQPLVW